MKNAPLTLEKGCVPGEMTALSGQEVDKIPAMDTMAGRWLVGDFHKLPVTDHPADQWQRELVFYTVNC